MVLPPLQAFPKKNPSWKHNDTVVNKIAVMYICNIFKEHSQK